MVRLSKESVDPFWGDDKSEERDKFIETIKWYPLMLFSAPPDFSRSCRRAFLEDGLVISPQHFATIGAFNKYPPQNALNDLTYDFERCKLGDGSRPKTSYTNLFQNYIECFELYRK